MQRYDLTLADPASLLAADEVLLDQCEDAGSDESLLFWEPVTPFVVVGYANKVETEVNVPTCAARGIPIFRRCTGGGTVVQLPGGLNYSLILRIHENGPTRNISAANEFIMGRVCAAIQSALGGSEPSVTVRGHTDLAIATPTGFLKIAGNAQRRRKHFLLFHGTFLLHCDLGAISNLLRMPSLEPDYRAGRSHADFITNLNLPAAIVKETLRREWQASAPAAPLPIKEIESLAREKYATQAWNYKF